jgi:hypothetical protein
MWKDRYRAALVEVDPEKLVTLIQEIEAAIGSRSESLPVVTTLEQQEMSDATCTLRILKGHANPVRVQGELQTS